MTQIRTVLHTTPCHLHHHHNHHLHQVYRSQLHATTTTVFVVTHVNKAPVQPNLQYGRRPAHDSACLGVAADGLKSFSA